MPDRKMYYMCKYTPIELFAGFGVNCERLEPDTDSFDMAESLGHPNMCGYGKGLLEAVMTRQIRELILVNCCDVVRRVYDILEQTKQLDFLYLLDLPHHAGEAEVRLFKSRIRSLLKAYEAYSGISFDEKAFLSFWGETGCRACGEPSQISGKEDEFSRKEVEEEQGSWISLQGAHSGAFLPELVKDCMPMTVRDETCTGNRFVPRPDFSSAGEEDVLTPYARALLRQMPCMRMSDASRRKELGKGASGIIYHTMKFCDFYGFEQEQIEKESKVPFVVVETDGTRQSEGQLSTRLEAFSEEFHYRQSRNRNGKGSGMRALRTEDHAADQKGGRSDINDGCGENGKGGVMAEGYTVGLDSGSASTDAVVLSPDGQLAGWAVVPTGAGAASGAEKALHMALEMAGITKEQVSATVTTGYGRKTVGMGEESRTEITCHARGAFFLNPSVRTIIDIGGQDSKIIKIDNRGAVVQFVMNDKCAAGTGRFLEMMARTLEMSLEEMSRTGLNWKEDVQISSMCTVFAESEVVSLVAQNKAPSDIVHGLNESIASRTAALVKRIGGEAGYMMTGGVAQNRGVVTVLEKKLGNPILVSEHAQLCGAIGAALLAREG
ncbi:MAG: 2-hydroxyacyl-CoA dehydratase [Eubacterium sp.]|nr:2-hydroxyacyl-CoA dehydratase [Eubacterium sp.]